MIKPTLYRFLAYVVIGVVALLVIWISGGRI